MDEIEGTICEECGCEFKFNNFNRFAPFAMCDDCYDDYIIGNFDEDEHEF